MFQIFLDMQHQSVSNLHVFRVVDLLTDMRRRLEIENEQLHGSIDMGGICVCTKISRNVSPPRDAAMTRVRFAPGPSGRPARIHAKGVGNRE